MFQKKKKWVGGGGDGVWLIRVFLTWQDPLAGSIIIFIKSVLSTLLIKVIIKPAKSKLICYDFIYAKYLFSFAFF